MKPEKLTQADVLRRARQLHLKFRIKHDEDLGAWVVLATSSNVAELIRVGKADTYEKAQAFVDEKNRQLQSLLPGIVKQVQDEEFPG
ncbi:MULTISPECIES: hypothetical protein [Rhodococcus]|uniref:hypothetical protein n=1 Tax=Rhodococcus TaxID=1827 RepID=UPI001E6272A0|nr:hypothetical protein [Rhodococcus pyridinivorans]MCD2116769.1 hypothetical protein [Rhodococcus pyridinivorans]MCZ4626023.1 hypothetical protein [Rhodococcus pyridinivorans]MCZ4646978.1 hypothetical protein [Rhodococcus pyridinivorans]MDJ0480330.1 hypothetical protein [Rhodococcus pyridinivorans]MDV7253082.1 hypothetical protein [Rhodococcus pyridinivorans]